MSNFEYIIASLPYLTMDYRYAEGQGFQTVLDEIRRDLSEKDTAFFKLGVKLPFLMSGSREQFRLWKEWFPEANRHISENRYIPLRTRMVQQCAAHGLFPLVRLYCFAVNKIFYGLHRLIG